MNPHMTGECGIDEAHSDSDHNPATFIVHWTDFVANEWTEIVEGPFEPTERRLNLLRKKGNDARDFGMTIIVAANDSIVRTMTADEFFRLDWGEWLSGEPWWPIRNIWMDE